MVLATIFPRTIPVAITSFFIPKGGDYSREGDYFKYSHWKSCPKYFCLIISNKLNIYGPFKCSEFSSLINFQSFVELSLISFAESDSSSTRQGGDNRRRW